jgi:hypothetical protein
VGSLLAVQIADLGIALPVVVQANHPVRKPMFLLAICTAIGVKTELLLRLATYWLMVKLLHAIEAKLLTLSFCHILNEMTSWTSIR